MDTKAAVDQLMTFFSTRLLQKRCRPLNRTDDMTEVDDCEAAFRALGERAAAAVESGEALVAVEWVDVCSAFSEEWIDVCHWVSPRKFRDLLTDKLGARWVGQEDVPAVREQPPIDLKWYKAADVAKSARPCACTICEVVCNSPRQYKMHIHGRAHKSAAARWAEKHGSAQAAPVFLDQHPSSPRAALELKRAKTARANDDASGKERDMSVSTSMSMSLGSTIGSMAPSSAGPASPGEHEMDKVASNLDLTLAGTPTFLPYDLSANPPMPYRMSLSSCASSAASEREETLCEGPVPSRRRSVLDAVYPLPLVPQAAVDGLTREQAARLDTVLARLSNEANGAYAEKAIALGSALAGAGAGDLVLHAIIDAGTRADNVGGIAAVAAAVVAEHPTLRTELEQLVAQTAPHARAAGLPPAVEESAVEEEVLALKANARRAGLLRLVGALLELGVLRVGTFLTSLSVALYEPNAQDIANACRAVTRPAVRACLTAAAAVEVRALFTEALSTKCYPPYVKEMVATL